LLVLESDALRQVLVRSASYSGPESARLFDACHALIGDLLREGFSILFDATNLIEDHRQRLYAIADDAGAKAVIVHVTAPSKVVHERLKDRSRGLDPEERSGADWEVYRKMLHTVEPISRDHLVVDTSRDISPAVSKVVWEIVAWIHAPVSKNIGAVS
jgi:predicted kinase